LVVVSRTTVLAYSTESHILAVSSVGGGKGKKASLGLTHVVIDPTQEGDIITSQRPSLPYLGVRISVYGLGKIQTRRA
jgi:hypothetical protein